MPNLRGCSALNLCRNQPQFDIYLMKKLVIFDCLTKAVYGGQGIRTPNVSYVMVLQTTCFTNLHNPPNTGEVPSPKTRICFLCATITPHKLYQTYTRGRTQTLFFPQILLKVLIFAVRFFKESKGIEPLDVLPPNVFKTFFLQPTGTLHFIIQEVGLEPTRSENARS